MNIKKIILVILPVVILLLCTVFCLWAIFLDSQISIYHNILCPLGILLPSWIVCITGLFNINEILEDFDSYSLWVIAIIPFISHIAIGIYIIAFFVLLNEKIADNWNL